MKKRAFTLIEAMVVMSIIAVLVTIVIPSFQHRILKGHADEAKVVIQSIVFAQERYKQENGNFYPNDNTIIKNENNISTKLKINLKKSNNFNYTLEKLADGNFTIKAILRADSWSECGTSNTASDICKQNGTKTVDNWVTQYNRAENKHYIKFRYPDKLSNEFVEGGISYEYLYDN